MARRGLAPLRILHELTFRSLLWTAYSVTISPGTLLRIVRALPSLETLDLAPELRARFVHLADNAEGIGDVIHCYDAAERERRWRSISAGEWLTRHAGRQAKWIGRLRKPTLISESGYEEAARVLKNIKTKYRILAPAIDCPGKKGRGGLKVYVRSAQKRRKK